jgi:hypothetical protein
VLASRYAPFAAGVRFCLRSAHQLDGRDDCIAAMYAAVLHLSVPSGRHDEIIQFLQEEMSPVIEDNEGFIGFQVVETSTGCLGLRQGRPGQAHRRPRPYRASFVMRDPGGCHV